MQLKRDTLLERGKYRILETLGRGGFGITYLAEQALAGRKVCIKEYFPKDYYNRDADTNRVYIGSKADVDTLNRYKEKFVKEASVLARLKHPHIVSVYDVFEENDTAYYVMEHIEGESLGDVVKRHGALDEATAVGYIRQIADALGYIHAQKINHLDVKPANVMVSSEDDSAILIDFGLAKHYDTSGGQTSSTPVGISHGYAPFEQYKSGGVSSFSPATDIYSLGATLYYLVTGEVPPSATDIGKDGIKTPDNLSPGVQRAIKEAMNYWREERPQSVEEFLKLLDDEQGVVAPVAEATIINVETKSVDESSVINVEPKQTPKPAPKNEPKPKNKRKSKKGLWLRIFLFVVAAVASFVLLGVGSSKKENAPKSAVATVDTLASSSDSHNLAKPEVDTLQLNDTPKEQPKEEPKPSETKPVTKPELILESESEVILPYDGGSGEIKYTIASESVECHIDEKQLFHREGTPSETKPVTKPEPPTKEDAKPVTQPNNEIWYTSSDGNVVKPYKQGIDIFGAEIESNTYKDGKGIIKFKSDVTTIGKLAFCECKSLTSVTIPNSVTTIGKNAFDSCRNLTSVTIPNSVTAIGYRAFAWCSNLTSVTIPNSVKTIGDEAFMSCKSLKSVTIPNSVTTIGYSVFVYCENLTSVTIPNSVTTIRDGAFHSCKSLKSVTIPDSVTTIGDGAFGDCSSIKEFNGKFASKDRRCLIIDGKLVAFAPAGITEYTIPNNVTTIGDYAFAYCDNLTSVTIPNSVTTIGNGAFMRCRNLKEFKGRFAFIDGRCLIINGKLVAFAPVGITKFTIPDSVTTIGDAAFAYYESLTSVTIPNSVTTIRDHAFWNCSSLTSVTIPNSVKTIVMWAFEGCDNLSEETKNQIKSINPDAKF